MDSLWTQHIFESFDTDDEELTKVALKASLADLHARVVGGDFGSPYSIGDYGFYSQGQFQSQADYLCDVERANVTEDFFLSDREWQKVDSYLTKTAYSISNYVISKAYLGDTFPMLAIRKSAFHVAIVFIQEGVDILLENEQGQDLIDVVKEQYGILATAFKQVLTKQIVYYRQTKTITEIKELRKEQTKMKADFLGLIDFVKACEVILQKQILQIERDFAFKRRCELLHEVRGRGIH